MKKTILILLAAFLALASCEKAPVQKEGNASVYTLDELSFDFTVEREDATKGIRSAWQSGDRLFLFFEAVNAAYLTIDFDGTSWSKPATLHVRDGESTPSLEKAGKMTAVYLPYGNSLEPSWNGSAWTFPSGTDFYFLRCVDADYYITDDENQIPSMGAYLYMVNADDYVQFYIPDDTASGSIQVACNAIIPAGIGGVSLDGSIIETELAQGTWITARADVIDGETGYYLSGRLAPRPGSNYYFALQSGTTYKHYYKSRDVALSGHHAYQLPDIGDWPTVTPDAEVVIAGNKWLATNAGASTPWEIGTAYDAASMNNAVADGSDTMVPSDTEWAMIQDRYKAVWIQLTIVGTSGFVVADRSAPGNFIFLPCAAYWTASAAGGDQHYFNAKDDGTHGIAESNPPATACVRLVSALRNGGFNPPENGGDI